MSRIRKAVRPRWAGLTVIPFLALALAPNRAEAQRAPDSEAPVEYSDVLANPDDAEINYRYARQKIEAGDLNRAASALERILILNPEADRIRLLYGIVLFRLGNNGEAEQELEAVDAERLNPEDRATLDATLAKLRRSRQSLRGSVGVTAGLHLDTNRNSFPDGGELQVDLPGAGETTLLADGAENTDTGQFLMLDGRAMIATDWQRVPNVTVEAALLGDNQVEEDDLDLLSGLASIRTTYYGDAVNVSPRVSYREVGLGGERYLRDVEGRLRLSRRLREDRGLIGLVEGTLGYEEFSGTERAPFADERDGAVVSGALGLRYAPVDRVHVTGRYRYKDKHADEDFEAFTEHRVRADALYVLDRGVTLSGQTHVALRDYDDADPFVSRTETRDDTEYFARLGVSVSLDRIAATLGTSLPKTVTDNFQVNLFGQYRNVDSNLPNFDYDNYRAEFSVSKRFAF